MTIRIRYRRRQLAREIQAAQPGRYSAADLRDMAPWRLALLYRECYGLELTYHPCGLWYGMDDDTTEDTQ